MMEASIKCIKYLLFAFNLLFALSGLILIITGAAIQATAKEYLDFLGSDFFNAPVLLIVVGLLIFGVTFFGCCGAIKENHCMTMTFAVMLGVILIAEISIGIAAGVMKRELRGVIEENMEGGLVNFGNEGYEGVTNTWNVVQHELQCCGVQNYADWKNTTLGQTKKAVPDTCCLTDVQGCGENVLSINESQLPQIIHTNGCLDKLEEIMAKNVAVLIGVGVGIAVLQLIGIVFACILSRTIKKEYETV